MDWEEIKTAFESIQDTFEEKWCQILSLSFSLFLALPFIKWSILAVGYIFHPTTELLGAFAISTFFDNALPWGLNLLLDPIKAVLIYVWIVLIITSIISWIDSRS